MEASHSPESLHSIEELLPEFENAEGIREYYGLRKDIALHTKEGEEELLEKMEDMHPDLNGRLKEAHDYVQRMYGQYLVNEKLHDDVKEEVSEAQMEKHKSFFRRHPVLTTAAGVAALIALLYFTGTIAPTAGEYGAGLIESFKDVLGSIGIGTPEVAMEAAAEVPVTGEIVSEEVARQGSQAFVSPSEALMENAEAMEAFDAATNTPGVTTGELTKTAEEVLQSPQAVEALKKAAETPEVADPLQRILQKLPPR